jgi:hypothetical protein
VDYKHKQAGKIAVHGAHGHDIDPIDLQLALGFSGLLLKHYPNHQWAVEVNSEGRVINVKNLAISGYYGFRVLMTRKTPGGIWYSPSHEELEKDVVKAGGEILERAGLKRGAFDQNAQVDFVEGITKLQYQPAVQRNIQKYADLLNVTPSATEEHRKHGT